MPRQISSIIRTFSRLKRILKNERILKTYFKLQRFSYDIVDSRILKKVILEPVLGEAGCVLKENSLLVFLYMVWKPWELLLGLSGL